jgi:hypothetical protein
VRWARQLLEGVTALAFVCAAMGVMAGAPDESVELLRRADSIKTAKREEFVAILASLDARANQLPDLCFARAPSRPQQSFP